MRLSVFTPSHDTRYLTEAYQSLAAQTHRDWEWVVLLNGKARQWSPPADDERVRVVRASPGTKGVGALKRAAVEHCTGEVLVELDHDDLLQPACLTAIVDAFEGDASVVLAFSDFAQINEDGSPDFTCFNPDNGWVYSAEDIDGVTYNRCHAMAPNPHNMGYIWYEPNHVRAFRRSAYDKVGGYNPDLTVLDDQELMMRLYVEGEFAHLDQLLYLQRMHKANTQTDPKTNAHIQEQTVALYRQHIQAMCLAWTARRGLRAVRILPNGWFGTESEAGFDDVVFDRDDPGLDDADDSVGVVLATDVLQRVADRAALLNMCHRVLPHSGMLLTLTPSTDGRGAFQDPSYVAYYNENSFMYLTQSELRMTIPDLQARFQVSHLYTHFPSPTHEQMGISYVQANLVAVKDGPRHGGPLLC